jgi:hypothetical protein
MTRDDIIRMARKANLHERTKVVGGYIVNIPNLENLERFAALAADWGAKQEREACAKVCDHMKNDIYNNSQEDTQPMAHAVANFCAAAIRARGEV